MKPSESLYATLSRAYDYLNSHLFDGTLPDVIFTLQRQSGMMGYFAPDRWASIEGKSCHEIAINPVHIGRSRLIDVLETLTHEMVHCWQAIEGKPSRTGYHNHEWALKMKEIGLQPSSTGKPGGMETGQVMSDYPIKDGLFLKVATAFIIEHKFRFPWLDKIADTPYREKESTFSATEYIPTEHQPTFKDLSAEDKKFVNAAFETPLFEQVSNVEFITPESKANKSKIKYSCPSCQTNVWGKPHLNIRCGDCGELFNYSPI